MRSTSVTSDRCAMLEALPRRRAIVVLENPGPNLLRGSQNMTTVDVSAAKAANRISEMRTVAKTLAKGGAKAGLVAAIFEVAISVPENILHYRRGRKSGKQAAEDTAKNTAIDSRNRNRSCDCNERSGPSRPWSFVWSLWRPTRHCRRNIACREHHIPHCQSCQT